MKRILKVTRLQPVTLQIKSHDNSLTLFCGQKVDWPVDHVRSHDI